MSACIRSPSVSPILAATPNMPLERSVPTHICSYSLRTQPEMPVPHPISSKSLEDPSGIAKIWIALSVNSL